jgi:transcriptional regulator with XRE-family HTH domain
MLALRLRELREDKDRTQAEIAEVLRITRACYSMYESGKRQVSYEALDILADYYKVSIDYLLGRQEEKPIKISEEETELLKKFKSLDNRGKQNILALVNIEFNRASSKSK